MENKEVRVRFAPAPTGMMHLGNVRTALLNYLFARKMNGAFVLRIEDTDQERNIDPQAQRIIDDLGWLGLAYNEGPTIGGPCGPYFQSQRTAIYDEWLCKLQHTGLAYRCFCTADELERKRARQIALKQPPRYDRTCLQLPASEIEQRVQSGMPFIWRMRLDAEPTLQITDLARGQVTFDMHHFSDFALTRQDGTFTFMFANFVDDASMRISHVIRGEDHLTNTAGQAALYRACKVPLPTFWHLSIICNVEGKKLSKRDFGFSLEDLRSEGFVPEAINNYLATIGGGTFEHEIMSLPELVQAFDVSHLHATSQIRYDVQKLRWMNHKWIATYSPDQVAARALPFVKKAYDKKVSVDQTLLARLAAPFVADVSTLSEIPGLIKFYFERPVLTGARVDQVLPAKDKVVVSALLQQQVTIYDSSQKFIQSIKQDAQAHNVPLKVVFAVVRLGLMGSEKGPAVHDLLDLLGADEARARLEHLVKIISD